MGKLAHWLLGNDPRKWTEPANRQSRQSRNDEQPEPLFEIEVVHKSGKQFPKGHPRGQKPGPEDKLYVRTKEQFRQVMVLDKDGVEHWFQNNYKWPDRPSGLEKEFALQRMTTKDVIRDSERARELRMQDAIARGKGEDKEKSEKHPRILVMAQEKFARICIVDKEGREMWVDTGSNNARLIDIAVKHKEAMKKKSEMISKMNRTQKEELAEWFKKDMKENGVAIIRFVIKQKAAPVKVPEKAPPVASPERPPQITPDTAAKPKQPPKEQQKVSPKPVAKPEPAKKEVAGANPTPAPVKQPKVARIDPNVPSPVPRKPIPRSKSQKAVPYPRDDREDDEIIKDAFNLNRTPARAVSYAGPPPPRAPQTAYQSVYHPVQQAPGYGAFCGPANIATSQPIRAYTPKPMPDTPFLNQTGFPLDQPSCEYLPGRPDWAKKSNHTGASELFVPDGKSSPSFFNERVKPPNAIKSSNLANIQESPSSGGGSGKNQSQSQTRAPTTSSAQQKSPATVTRKPIPASASGLGIVTGDDRDTLLSQKTRADLRPSYSGQMPFPGQQRSVQQQPVQKKPVQQGTAQQQQSVQRKPVQQQPAQNKPTQKPVQQRAAQQQKPGQQQQQPVEQKPTQQKNAAKPVQQQKPAQKPIQNQQQKPVQQKSVVQPQQQKPAPVAQKQTTTVQRPQKKPLQKQQSPAAATGKPTGSSAPGPGAARTTSTLCPIIIPPKRPAATSGGTSSNSSTSSASSVAPAPRPPRAPRPPGWDQIQPWNGPDGKGFGSVIGGSDVSVSLPPPSQYGAMTAAVTAAVSAAVTAAVTSTQQAEADPYMRGDMPGAWIFSPTVGSSEMATTRSPLTARAAPSTSHICDDNCWSSGCARVVVGDNAPLFVAHGYRPR